ncbi:DUF4139 domain-containing protein [Arundinibacter roseus]|uniref:Mucoidy inhibitor MuiA family protein n=1 Tax=Arundinibacter roseus TaxID=2070510 RepID=A0A4R4KJ08_9BACT|nr:DUF4139 domain-containing protein [Arundinibacter roseus]TDB68257.1 mucoidy inhibitor MuiA family protein [Arundinibacter roseus]
MKKILSFIAISLSTFSLAFAQTPNEQIISTTLTHATVFLNRAQLTATAKATLQAGEQRVILDNIPLSIDPGSIEVRGTGGAIIKGVRFERDYLQRAQRPAGIIRMEDSLKIVQNQLAVNLITLTALDEERALIVANKQAGGTAAGVKVADLKALADFYRERLADIGTRQLQIKDTINRLKERENNIKNQLADWQNRRNQPTGQILVNLSATARTSLQLEVSYVVADAGWMPVYDVRVKDTQSPVSLAYKANVYQNTGQNWEAIKLTLSTSNPSLNGTKPELGTQFVQFEQPVVMRKERMRTAAPTAAMNSSEQSIKMDMSVPEVELITSASFTQMNTNDLSVSFEIALPYTIPSNGSGQVVDIAQHEVAATYRHFAIPKLDPDAFLIGTITDWEKYNLLNGQANVYFQGTYVGETQLLTQNTADTLNLSLGRDKKIIIKRERMKDFTATRILGNQVRETVAYRVTIRNTKNEAATITLEDQIPVSTNSDIEVKLEESTGATYTSETGRLTWKLSLKANESRTVEFRYEIKYPKGRIITY